MQDFNSDLIEDLARERVVIFVGAGVSASAQAYSGGRILNWEEFLRSCLHAVPADVQPELERILSVKDYLLAAEILQSTLEEDWAALITDQFGRRATPSSLHEAILSLQQRIILTTNFDKLLETSADAFDKSESHYRTVIAKVDDSVFQALKDHSQRYIIKIHGSVDDIATLVFSRSEYIRLAFGNTLYAGFLENLLLNYTFIFIGFSMDDPAITSLMEMYSHKYPRARPHYIFAAQPISEYIVNINKRLRKLIYMQYDSSNNHAQLPIMITRLAEESAGRRKEIFAASQVERPPF